jgi:hypothetical protein
VLIKGARTGWTDLAKLQRLDPAAKGPADEAQYWIVLGTSSFLAATRGACVEIRSIIGEIRWKRLAKVFGWMLLGFMAFHGLRASEDLLVDLLGVGDIRKLSSWWAFALAAVLFCGTWIVVELAARHWATRSTRGRAGIAGARFLVTLGWAQILSLFIFAILQRLSFPGPFCVVGVMIVVAALVRETLKTFDSVSSDQGSRPIGAPSPAAVGGPPDQKLDEEYSFDRVVLPSSERKFEWTENLAPTPGEHVHRNQVRKLVEESLQTIIGNSGASWISMGTRAGGSYDDLTWGAWNFSYPTGSALSLITGEGIFVEIVVPLSKMDALKSAVVRDQLLILERLGRIMKKIFPSLGNCRTSPECQLEGVLAEA